MPKHSLCIRITGTRTGKLRARVEQPGQERFEVTIGGDKWHTLDLDLQGKIIHRAHKYMRHLGEQLDNHSQLVDEDGDTWIAEGPLPTKQVFRHVVRTAHCQLGGDGRACSTCAA